MIERDDNIPPLGELVDELNHTRALPGRHLGCRFPHAARTPWLPVSVMRLAQLQSAFQAALLDGSSGVLEHLGTNAREPKDVMFGVYRNAYVFRLADILADDFERLHTYIGDEAFFSLARAYIAAHPSQSANARDFGRGFPKFVF